MNENTSARKTMSVQPLVDPSAQVKASRLGRYTEVGARTKLLEVELADYSYVVNDSDIAYAQIGKFCSIAAMTRINPGNHPMHRASQAHFTYRASAYFPDEDDDHDFFAWRRAHRVTIGHDVWIGHGAIVLPGRSIGTGAVIAAGAIVTKDVAPYTIVAGNPARVVRLRFPEAIAARLQALAWWDWPHERLHAALPDFRALSVEAFLDRYQAAPGRVHTSAVALEGAMELKIVGAQALLDEGLIDTPVHVSAHDGVIADVGAERADGRTLDAAGLMLLPGVVDIHGDAFERQIMPRPGVDVALDIGLVDSDRQAVANGITTVFHGVTWSWEPGLRGAANARAILAAIEELEPRLAADTKFHLRHETYNLAAEPEVVDWLGERRIGALAFNDHLPTQDNLAKRPDKLAQMVARSGVTHKEFVALVERLRGDGAEVPHSIGRLAKEANAHGVALLSHDDASPQTRQWFRALGCRVSEFPMTIDTARDAAAAGDQIVLGSPNVMRGGSHLGWVNASDMIAQGLCSVLASDYYYPAPLVAAFRLAADGVVPFAQAWRLVSGAPAHAVGLDDRGSIARGRRADLILVDASIDRRPRVVGVMVAGRMVHIVEPDRIKH